MAISQISNKQMQIINFLAKKNIFKSKKKPTQFHSKELYKYIFHRKSTTLPDFRFNPSFKH